MREEIKNWMLQAEADLKTAHDDFKAKNYYATAQFSQQSTEKAIKAYYMCIKSMLAPKTHNIVFLAQELSLPEVIQKAARLLAPAFITSRYPDAAIGVPAQFYREDNTLPLIKAAEEVLAWIKKQLKD